MDQKRPDNAARGQDAHGEPTAPLARAGGRDELPPPLPLLPSEPGDGRIPPNQPRSFGSGPDNPAGLRLEYERDGDLVRATTVLDTRFEGARGVLHGGIAATLLDDVMGAVLRSQRQRAVTAQLDVTYIEPIVIGQPLTIEAWIAEVDGRKLRLVGRVRNGDRTAVVGRALFIAVRPEHYTRLGVPVPEPGTQS